MIKTKKFQLTKKEYFLFLIRLLLKRRWWLYAFILLISIVILFSNNRSSSDNFIIAFGFIYPILSIFQYWRFAYSKENGIISKKDNLKFSQIESLLKWEKYLKVQLTSKIS